MAVTKEEVKRIAELARLTIEESEVSDFVTEMNRLLDYMDKLNELDTTDIEPLSHPLEGTNFFREDKVIPSLPISETMKNAPSSDGEFFLVPKVIRGK